MATYNRTYAGESTQDLSMSFSVVERSIYGSSRVANFVDSVQLVFLEAGDTEFSYPADNDILSHTNGYKHFELTNHLGNVMAVVSDIRTPITEGSGTLTRYTPELLIAKDYYPFGMEMSGRYGGDLGTEPDDEYRFGFNGKEKDDEWNGQTGSTYDFGARLYDARIGRWMAVDPLAGKLPGLTPYAFGADCPILFVDDDGRENVIYIVLSDNNNEELRADAELVATQATAMFDAMLGPGKMKVVVWQPETAGEKFDFKYLDRTDSYVLYGEVNAVKEMVNELGDQKLKSSIFENNNIWTGTGDNPERAGGTESGGVIDINGEWNLDKWKAFLILHIYGHNLFGPGHYNDDNNLYLMKNGKTINRINFDESSSSPAEVWSNYYSKEHNSKYIDAMILQYETKTKNDWELASANDNYRKNKKLETDSGYRSRVNVTNKNTPMLLRNTNGYKNNKRASSSGSHKASF